MKLLNLSLLLASVIIGTNANIPIGFGEGTTGGQGGRVYHVNTLKEFKNALNNNGNPNGKKIIYIDSPINGYVYDNGSLMTEESLFPEYSFQQYLNCFTSDGTQSINSSQCQDLLKKRTQAMKKLQSQIKVKFTSNTSIIGKGNQSKIEELSFQIVDVNNVILQNLSIKAPNDLFPEYGPSDGWKARYDAITIQGSSNIWIDNCYLTDGDKTVEKAPIYFNNHIERHDGLVDIIKGSDLVTISNSRFEDHIKTMLIGSSDTFTADRDHLRVTIYNNVFINCHQRMPRVRYGKVHIFNNYYYADDYKKYPVTYNNGKLVLTHYYLGLGYESNVLSEYNSFNFPDNRQLENTNVALITNFGGYIFNDIGSQYNGNYIDMNSLAKRDFEKNRSNGNSFTTNTFNPHIYYNYNITNNIRNVNDLINQVPTWMFN
ncbi:pectin lyase-like protein [Anaeromyces robustus]|uniref:Pectin lyase-like protein n=1 Tax=Anaeromyces robustus TaxID=1754192 RepID=A0A1Y1XGI9_9FUNG|nr:pectin lyase-like protein [Anaeromyces robustus]|eukprot:ORX84878.1 pectin lyase-like protein [Anaeromyces robustus]